MSNIKRKPLPNRRRLRELLHYEPATGIFRWKINRSPKTRVGMAAGAVTPHGYLMITVDGEAYFAHRLAWLYVHGESPDNIDHRNGSPADNWIDNLRPASQSLNRANSRRRIGRKVDLPKGVVIHKRRFRAQLYLNRKRTIIGYFDTPSEAAAAYRLAARETFGDFARFG